jgi:hypothetical protein
MREYLSTSGICIRWKMRVNIIERSIQSVLALPLQIEKAADQIPDPTTTARVRDRTFLIGNLLPVSGVSCK